MRKTIIAANWKMNMTSVEAEEFISSIKDSITDSKAEVHIIPPFTSLVTAGKLLESTDVILGAQNMYYEDKGAYTGEISAAMLKDLGVKSVIIGHSERREYFKEDDTIINLKVKKALEAGLTPIICCGESLELRESGKVNEWIRNQITEAFKDVDEQDAIKCIIAYEPIWAIGTGKVATSEQAQEICKMIRETIGEIYSSDTASDISILYGGSVKKDNCEELFACPDIDGGLIGGAGLKPEFVDIVKAGEKSYE